jgi:lysozyme
MPTPNETMQLSPAGLLMLKGFEALRLQAYIDIRGRWTIGYGHTGPEVCKGLTWTPDQASIALEEDALWAERAVQQGVSVPLLQHQFDPLVTFTYNVGATAFTDSTLLHLLNAGDFAGAGAQFLKWIYAGDVISTGLLNRRKVEQAMFLGG